jgi:hypothetical protein
MTDFSFQELIDTSAWESAAMGASTLDTAGKGAGQYTSKDVGRAMKFDTTATRLGTYIECALNDDIQGFIASIEPFPVNSGFSFGSIQKGQRRRVKAAGAITLGANVVAGSSPTVGATQTLANVVAGAGVNFKWRFIHNFTSPGQNATSGHEILVEKI